MRRAQQGHPATAVRFGLLAIGALAAFAPLGCTETGDQGQVVPEEDASLDGSAKLDGSSDVRADAITTIVVARDAAEDVANDATETDATRDGATDSGAHAEGGATPDATSDAAPDDASDAAVGAPSDATLDAPNDAAALDDASDGTFDAPPDEGADVTADSASDAAEGGIVVTTESILDALGPGCLDCAINSACLDPSQSVGSQGTCEDLGTATALAGPLAGTLRSALCLSALQCIGASACVLPSDTTTPCYCGEGDCGGGGAPVGPCIAQEQAGLESTSEPVILGSWNDPTLGAGMANNIAGCVVVSCDFVCFPSP